MLKRGLASFALFFIVVVYFVFPLMATVAIDTGGKERLSPYSDDYDDLSDFKDDIENAKIRDEDGDVVGDYEVYSIVASPTILNGPDVQPENTIYIGVGMEKRYTDEEISALLEFLRRGGHAILADDYGYLYEFARYLRVTYYRGKFFDNEFDKNENFTIVNAKLGVDHFTPKDGVTQTEIDTNSTYPKALNNLQLQPPDDSYVGKPLGEWQDEDPPWPDGIWDSDQDGDGRIDEDPPEKGTPIDDDMDLAKSLTDGLDNDHDGKSEAPEDENEPKDDDEGLNEDPLDDDGDWIDLNNNGVQEPLIWVDKNKDDKFTVYDTNGNERYDLGESIVVNEHGGQEDEYISGDYGVDEERFDGLDNDGDGMIDEDLEGYRILFNDATGIASTGNRIIARGGTSDPPSYVNLDNEPGANTPSADETLSKDVVVDEISSAGSEIQLIIEVLVCPKGGGAVDIRTGKPRGIPAPFDSVDASNIKHKTKDYLDFGSVIFISDSSMLVNDIYKLDHLATDDDTNEIYRLDDFGNPVQNIKPAEWENIEDVHGVSSTDINEATAPDESKRNYIVDHTADGEMDYENRKFAIHLVKYILPDGGRIIFDESRHFQENEFLKPVYTSIYTITFLTSDPWYSSAMIIIFILILSFAVGYQRKKENWVHRHNINILRARKSLPTVRSNQLERIRWAVLNKARMDRGLSPEEFKVLSTAAVNDIIKDAQMVELVRNTSRTYSDEELKLLMKKISAWGK